MVSNPFSGEGLVVNISADSSGLQRELNTAIAALGAFDKAVIAVGGSLMAISTGAFVSAINTTREFENSMVNSLSISGEMSQEMEGQFYDMARSIARELPFAASEVADGFYYLASAGLSAEEQLAAMPAIAEFATATQMDLANASDVATNVMSAMGLEAEDLNWVMDQLTGTITGHNTTAELLGGALANAAPTASMLGMELHELNAYIGAMADVGKQGTEAGTLLRSMMIELAEPTGKAATKLNEMGIVTHDSQGQMLPMIDILEQMEDAGLGTAEVFDIFGRQGGQAAAILLQTGVPALRDYMDAIEDTGGLTEEVAEYQMQSFHNQVELLKTSLADIGIEIGMTLLPYLKQLVGWISNGVEAFARINSATNGWFGIITLLGTFLTGLVLVIGGLASAVGGLSVLLAPVVGAFTFLASVINVLTSPMMLLAGAKMAVVGALKLLVAGLAALFSPIGILIGLVALLAYAFATDFAGIRTMIMRVVDVFGTQFVGMLHFVYDIVSTIVGDLLTVFDGFGGGTEEALIPIVELIGDVLVDAIIWMGNVTAEWLFTIEEWWYQHGDSVVATLQWIVDGAVVLIGGLVALLIWLFDTTVEVINACIEIYQWFRESIEMAFEAVNSTIEWFGELVEEVITFAQELIAPFVEWFAPIWEENVGATMEEAGKTWSVWMEIAEYVIDTITEKVDAFVSWIEPYWTAWLVATKEEWDRWSGEILELLDIYVTAFTEEWERWSGEILDLVEWWTTATKEEWERWSGEVLDIVDYFSGDILGIIEFLFDGIMSTAEWFFAASQTAFQVFFKILRADWEGAFILIWDFVMETFEGIYSFFSEWSGRFISRLSEFIGDIVQWFKDLYHDLVGGSIVPDMLRDILDAFSTFASDSISWLAGFIADFLRAWLDFTVEFWTTIANALTDVYNEAVSFGGDTISWLGGFASDFVSTVVTWANDTYRAFFDGLDRVYRAIVSFGSQALSEMGRIARGLVSEVLSVGTQMFNAGKSLVQSFTNGIKNVAAGPRKAFNNALSRVRDLLPGSDAKRGPLDDLEASSLAIPETLAGQMLSGRRMVSNAAEEMAQAATVGATAHIEPNAAYASDSDAINKLERAMAERLDDLIGEVRRGEQRDIRMDGKRVGEVTSRTLSRKKYDRYIIE